MKKLLLFALIVASLQLSAQQMLVGSYNIRYKNANDSLQGEVWAKRCQVICDQVNFMAPDVFGTQEVLWSQLQDMKQALDGYDYIGVGRDDGKQGGEHEAIFYKKRKLRLLDHGDFWLSETPDKPGLGWDAVCIRICTWGKFAVKTQKEQRNGVFNRKKSEPALEFYFFNLHMDHVGVIARREAAKLVVQRIREMADGYPVILTGDFNVDQNDEIYTIFTESGLLKDSFDAARIRFAENGTFNAFKTNYFTTSRIDHVFVSPTTTVEAYGVLTNSYWTPDEDPDDTIKASDAPQQISFDTYIRHNPSDHYPVFVKIKL
ncbi:MAG: endonuclease/exonuclease/phosphatase family protein [Bacteroidales bacterium]|nr:endonuclease/exonuclease/phosphatase family protein [Bacteroidales bacterium]MBR0540035.1 endonuclease/exonuclease/phosphatase family protein [Bacteroidales bacterium]